MTRAIVAAVMGCGWAYAQAGDLLPGDHSRTVAAWAKANGCPSTPKVEDLPDRADDGATVQRHTYGPGREGSEVVVYRIEGGGHTWPGSRQGLAGMLGPTTRDISANEIIWAFFNRHPMGAEQTPKPAAKPKADASAGR